jgi:epoxide hydrolase 4
VRWFLTPLAHDRSADEPIVVGPAQGRGIESAVVEHLQIDANGLNFYAAAAGPPDGPLVFLLHGFPEFSFGWRHQLAPLAAAGLRVVAPDQRGYGFSDKPAGLSAYKLETLAADIVAMASALGRDRFSVVGHDWGGIVAWHLASDLSDCVERVAIINAPNLDVALHHALRSPSQLLKSSYVGMFQLPWIPELALTTWNCALLTSALQWSSKPGTFSPSDMSVYREAWTKDGAMTAMLNWYRALPLTPQRKPKRIAIPALVIWGDMDGALDMSLAEESAALCDAGQTIHIPDATHWVHHEEVRQVNELLLAFFAVPKG